MKNKTFGIYILAVSILLLILILLSTAFLFTMALSSGVHILTLIPLAVVTFFLLTLSILGIYTGIRYIKGNTFKKNRRLGTTLIILGLIYLGYSLIVYILSNLTGNYGGEIKPVFAFLLCTVLVPLGLILKNPEKTKGN